MLEEAISGLPLYRQWDLCLLWGAYLLCLIVPVVRGALTPICGLSRPSWQPYPDTDFPNKWDIAFVFLYLALFINANSTLMIALGEKMEKYSISAAITNLIIYTPVLLRFRMMPTSPLRANWSVSLAAAFLVVFVGSTFNIIYTYSGLLDYISTATGSPQLQDVALMIKDGDLVTCATLAFTAVIVAPICEECLFRGFLYNIVKKYSCGAVAAVLTSIVFGAVHISLAQTLPLVVFALLLCFIYERTHSLRACLLAHALFNAISVISLIFFGVDF